MSNSREFQLLSNCVSVRICFIYTRPPIIHPSLSLSSPSRRASRSCVDECLCQCGLSEMYTLFTADNLRIGSIDVHTNYDRSIFVFRLDEPVRQSRVR